MVYYDEIWMDENEATNLASCPPNYWFAVTVRDHQNSFDALAKLIGGLNNAFSWQHLLRGDAIQLHEVSLAEEVGHCLQPGAINPDCIQGLLDKGLHCRRVSALQEGTCQGEDFAELWVCLDPPQDFRPLLEKARRHGQRTRKASSTCRNSDLLSIGLLVHLVLVPCDLSRATWCKARPRNISFE